MTKPITILGETYHAPLRYSAGHTCSPEEAAALNALFHQDIAGALRKAAEKSPGLDLSALFDQIVRDHAFSRLPTAGFDPIRREAFKIAKPKVAAALTKRGIDVATLSEKEWEGFLEQALAKQPAFLEEAKKRVTALREFTKSALEE